MPPRRATAGGRVTIVSADKDLMQLVAPGIEMFDTLKNKPIGPDEVFEKFGVGPERVIDVQALAGDSVDNVPGAPGIGIKTAAALIQEYGDLDTLLARADEIKQPKRREVLTGHADQIRISRDLVTLRRDVALEEPLAALEVRAPDGDVLLPWLALMEFRRLSGRVAATLGVGAPAIEPVSAVTASPVSGREPAPVAPIDHARYVILRDAEALAAWLGAGPRARGAGARPRHDGGRRDARRARGDRAVDRAGGGRVPAAGACDRVGGALRRARGGAGAARPRRWRCSSRCSRIGRC